MADADRKRELIAQIDRARSRAAAHREGLTDDLQVTDRVKGTLKESVEQNRGIWLGGAAIIGLLISKIPPRTKVLLTSPGSSKTTKEVKQAGKTGFLVAALAWAFNLVKPMLIRWGTQKAQQYLSNSS